MPSTACGRRSCRPSSFAKARAIARTNERKAWEFSEIGPIAYEGACTQHEERAANCRRCKIRAIEEGLREQCEREIAAELGDEDAGEWEIEDIEADLATVGRMLDDAGGRIDPGWPFDVAALARVLVGEKQRVKFEREWQRMQELKAKK